MYDTIIIGRGCAGLAAGMYAGRLKMKTLVLGEIPGGTIILTNMVENYPGFKLITGEELTKKLEEHAREYDIEIKQERVTKVARGRENCFDVKTESDTYSGKTVIFATGTKHRELKVKGAEEFNNRGVHYCALCDGPLYKGKVLGVVGGSDSAAKEALLLADYGKKVYIIYRKKKIRPEPVNAKRIGENSKIEIITNTNITEIKGDDRVRKVVLDREYKGSKELDLDGIFVAIGGIPQSSLAKDLGVKTNKKGEIIIDRQSRTNIEGVFAAGDVVDTSFKQAITGVAEGVTAAYHAYRYVSEKDFVCTHTDDEYNEK